MDTTRLSTKGQIILPAARFPRTGLEEVAGCLRSRGKSKTPAQMRAAVDRELARRYEARVGLWGRLATCGELVTRLPTLAKQAVQRRLATGAQDAILPHNSR